MNALQTKHSRFTWLPAMVSLAFALAFALAFNPCAAFANENEAQKGGTPSSSPAATTEPAPDETGIPDEPEAGQVQPAPAEEPEAGPADQNNAQITEPAATNVIAGETTTESVGKTTDAATSGDGDATETNSEGASSSAADEDDCLFVATLSDGTTVKVQQIYTVQIEQSATTSNAKTALGTQSGTSVSKVGLSYRTHVQNIGWQNAVVGGKTAGTSGKSLRLEALRISLTGMGTNKGHVKYRTHVQNIGWQKAVRDGALSGTSGKSLRLEGVKIWLTGDIAKHYDIMYRTHVQNIGWQAWVKNGSLAGTTGKSLRLEAIQIRLSAKTEEAAGKGADYTGVRYDARVQNKGWQTWRGDGATSGTTGKGLRIGGLNIVLSPGSHSGGITYEAHVQNIGWQGYKKDGALSGTSDKKLRIEAMRVKLSGDIAKDYNVYYRTHVQNYGWLDWAKNGQVSGSTGCALRVEAYQVVLVKKGEAAPGETEYRTVNSLVKTLNGIDIASWQSDLNVAGVPADFVIVKATGGVGYTNPYWKSQAKAALSSGKLLGLYHYARENGCSGSATAEADYFVSAVKSQGYVGKAVLFLDWEASALDLGPSWAKAWLDRVYSQTKVKPLIYMSKSVTSYYNWSSVAPTYKLWVAQYPNYNTVYGYLSDPWTDSNGYGAWSAPTLFQYTGTGRLSGYNSDLDLDLFYGNQKTWRALAAKS